MSKLSYSYLNFGSASNILCFVLSMSRNVFKNSFNVKVFFFFLSVSFSEILLSFWCNYLFVLICTPSLSSSTIYLESPKWPVAASSTFPWSARSSITLFTFDCRFYFQCHQFLFLYHTFIFIGCSSHFWLFMSSEFTIEI